MPLNIDHVYTDRARVRRRERGARIEHETQMVESLSPWFKGRIAVAYQFNDEGFAVGRRPTESTHQFICKLTDVAGAPVDIRPEDRIEVQVGPPPYSTTGEDAGIFEITKLPFRPRNLQERLLWVLELKQLKET